MSSESHAILGDVTSCFQYPAAGASDISRTFDRLDYAVERVAASRARVEQMLSRIVPSSTPNDKSSVLNPRPGAPEYAVSLDSLFGELDRLGNALDELAHHI